MPGLMTLLMPGLMTHDIGCVDIHRMLIQSLKVHPDHDIIDSEDSTYTQRLQHLVVTGPCFTMAA